MNQINYEIDSKLEVPIQILIFDFIGLASINNVMMDTHIIPFELPHKIEWVSDQ